MSIFGARKIVQILMFSLLLLPVVWPLNPVWIGTYLSSNVAGIALADPLAAVEVTLAGRHFGEPLFWSVIPLLMVTFVLGRVFCSWICPLNTALELAAMLKTPKVTDTRNGWLPYLILGVFLMAAVAASLPLFTILSPIGILSRAITVGAGMEFFLVITIVTLEWLYDRKAWCRKFCPAGALYGLLGKWRQLTVGIDPARCKNCHRCRHACTMRVNIGNCTALDHLTCTNCGDCVHACTEQAVYYTWRNKKKGGTVPHESNDGVAR
ncbi:4Fe-4S binding protein [Sporomusa aerivorans]|uniref:4Fe-4S binding protein n=1 Tax=Sporomusa aerivorans TaxID=204936 RepID=UPI00352A84FA